MNKRRIHIFSELLTAGLFAIGIKVHAQAKIMNLRCEHLNNPLGIDAQSPRLSWQGQTTYKIIVGSDSVSVSHGRGNMWSRENFKSDSQIMVYRGKALQPFTKYFWKVNASTVASFETGMMEMKNWKGSWISDTRDIHLKPAAYFKKEFVVNKKIMKARAYIAVAGLYELYINGKKIGDHFLDPTYTRFDRRNMYVTYDVTKELKEGSNEIKVLLGNGWYNHQPTAVWNFDQAHWRGRPSFYMDLRITGTDGSVQTISTDESWKTALSPVIFNSIYTGEIRDATKENIPDSAWKQPIFVSAPSQNIVAQAMHPIRLTDTVTPINMRKFSDTDYVFDIGRNIAGVSQLKLHGEKGTVIKLKHGENLDSIGHVDQSNIIVHYRPTDDTDPFQTDIYILKGEGEESFMPHFNYKGFQYVEVTSNKPVELKKENLLAYFAHSDVPAVGKINSSSPIINKIWEAANNSYLSNLFGYPTDCPQREKNGWTGDAQIAVETGLYNFDAITVYEKWMADHRDEQQPNGVLPSIIPTSLWGYEWGNGPDWTSSIAIIPWNLYLFYGDSRCLKDCYPNIKRYVDHIDELFPSGLCSWGLGDWVPVKSKTPKELTSTCYYYADATILASAAKLFHNDADYAKYHALAEKIKNAFNKKYFDESTGIYADGFQTELSVPLFWGLVPENQQTKVAAALARKVVADGTSLDVGLLGSKAILNALSENGYADLAYQLASKETFPSWGYWIKKGATTFFENWNIDAGRDLSLNHIMFGEISAWFYKALGGIKPDPAQPGFKNILLHPYFVKGLDHFSCYHDGPYGRIESSWKRSGDKIQYTVVVPSYSTADLFLPGKSKQILGAGIHHFMVSEKP